MTALTLLLWVRAGRSGRLWPITACWIVLAFLVAGTRDTMIYSLTTVGFLLAVSLPLLKQQRRRRVAVAVVGLALVIGTHDYWARTSIRWTGPLLNVLLDRILPDEGARSLWLDRYGLPENEEFLGFAGKRSFHEGRPGRRIRGLVLFPKDEEETETFRDVREWFLADARWMYIKYLISRPWATTVESANAFLEHLNYRRLSKENPAHRVRRWNRSLTGVVFPRLSPMGLLVVLLATGAVLGAAIWQSPRNRPLCAVAVVLIANAWVQMFVSYHGDTHDLGRHSIYAGVLLRMGLMITFLLGVSVIAARAGRGVRRAPSAR